MAFSGFFGQSFWQGIVSGLLVALILSGSAMGVYTRITKLTLAWKDIIISWLLLGVFFFAAILAYSISQPKSPPWSPPQYVALQMANNSPQPWPPVLTKTDIENWSLALKPYHQKVKSVIVGFVDIGQRDFVASLAQAISEAQWPEPSLQPGTLNVGLRIAASKDVSEGAHQLQELLQEKLGPVRLDQIPDKVVDKTGAQIKTPSGLIAIYVGWKPQ